MKRIILFYLSILLMGCLSLKNIQSEQEVSEIEILPIVDSINQNIDPEYFIVVPNEFLGIYLPIEYIEKLRNTKNHSIALHLENTNYHSFLNVQKNIIYSDLKWHDGYAIKKMEFESYQTLKDLNNFIIIDDNGNKYIRISNELNNVYKIIDEYVAKIVLNELLREDKISINKNIIDISGKSFLISLDDMFFPRDCNLIIFNREEKLFLGLKIIGKNYNFYRILPGEDGPKGILTDEEVYQISAD